MRYLRYDQLGVLVKEHSCKKIVEVGVYKGNSAIKMINASIQAGNKPGEVDYYGFDLFELMTKEIFDKEVSKWAPSEEEVLKKIEKTKANIRLYKGFSKDTIPVFASEGIVPDFIFIDGGHSIETLESDWNMLKEVVDNKSIVVFDDYISNFDEKKYGCNGLVDSLDTNDWEVEILPTVDKINEDFSIQFAKVRKR
jgi:predicted O-methyltransferase YrrM